MGRIQTGLKATFVHEREQAAMISSHVILLQYFLFIVGIVTVSGGMNIQIMSHDDVLKMYKYLDTKSCDLLGTSQVVGDLVIREAVVVGTPDPLATLRQSATRNTGAATWRVSRRHATVATSTHYIAY